MGERRKITTIRSYKKTYKVGGIMKELVVNDKVLTINKKSDLLKIINIYNLGFINGFKN